MIFIFILILIYSISLHEDISYLGVHTGSEWYQYITYSFYHTSFWHLIINSLGFILYWEVLKRFTNKYICALIAFASAILSALICAFPTPTIGASAVVYSLVGIYCTGVFIGDRLEKKIMYRTFIFIAISLILPALVNHRINWLLHIAAVFYSVFFSLVLNKVLYVRRK